MRDRIASSLEKATANQGGDREKALGPVHRAVGEVRKGIGHAAD